MPEIFISYATPDKARARSIYDRLKARWDCWMAPEDIPAGADWPESIFDAITKSRVFVLILSASAMASQEVRREMELARKRDLPILPFALEETDLKPAFAYYLSTIQQLRAHEMNAQEAEELLQTHISRHVPPRPIATPRSSASFTTTELRPEVWEEILLHISDGRVATVVGPEVLEATVPGRRMAERVAERLRIATDDLPDTGAFAEVAGRWIDMRGNIDDLFRAMKNVLPTEDQVELPESLVQLASIRPLDFFITTWFDPPMERALNQVRFGGNSASQQKAVVFHLSEALRLFDSADSWPSELLHELKDRLILYIGGSLPDTLAHSFFRSIQGRPIGRRPQKIIVADSHLRTSTEFHHYARRSGISLAIYPRGAVEFVNELFQRWNEYCSPPPAPTRETSSVFISFANEDRSQAHEIAKLLDDAGVPVRLNYEESESVFTRSAIRKCSAYVAVISRNAATSVRVQSECTYALDAANERSSSMDFIVPVLVDDTPRDSIVIALPSGLPWLRLDEDKPEIVRRIVRLYRDDRRRNVG